MKKHLATLLLGTAIGAGIHGAVAADHLVVKELSGHDMNAAKTATVDDLAKSWGCHGAVVSMTFLSQQEGGWAYHIGCPMPDSK